VKEVEIALTWFTPKKKKKNKVKLGSNVVLFSCSKALKRRSEKVKMFERGQGNIEAKEYMLPFVFFLLA